MVTNHLMLALLTQLLSKQFFRFLIVGGISTGIDFCLFTITYYLWHVPLIFSNILAYGTGLGVSFIIHKLWTFHYSRPLTPKKIGLYILIGYSGLILNTVIVWLSSYVMPVWAGKIVAVGCIIFYNYYCNKRFIFATPYDRSFS